jgi:uncharacterized membrane protein YsdA (DUF1294 family)
MSINDFFIIIVFILIMFSLMMLVHYLIDKYKGHKDKWWFNILIFFFVLLTPITVFLRNKK